MKSFYRKALSIVVSILLILIFIPIKFLSAQSYPDQHYYMQDEQLIAGIESMSGIEVSADGKKIQLKDGITSGTVVFKPDSSEQPFNRGLPSWNGHVPNNRSSFKVMMRFYNNGWSPWLTVGFWKENLWSGYGQTSYSGGKIEIDYAVLNSYHSKWQFQVYMKRTSSGEPSPSLNKLSFFVSDQRTTDNVNLAQLVVDKPASIFIPTQHYYQYSLDPVIGGDICSPTSVAMVLRSYNIDVDPLQFARENRDPYWGIFGVWPRTVQNGVEFGLNGTVTRYRSWSDARKTLEAGGRVVMSVGYPLYPAGHLMMLAGFDDAGNPIAHDPARSNGYSYKWDKTSLSRSWFLKGGVAYTFFPQDSAGVTAVESEQNVPEKFMLYSNFPNPFNSTTQIKFSVPARQNVLIKIYDVLGNEISTIVNEEKDPGTYTVGFNADQLTSGFYFFTLQTAEYSETRKMVLLK